MPWVGLDDQFFHNRKARAVGPEGRELFVASLSYSNMQLNDGCFVAEDVPVIAALAQVQPDIAGRLTREELWHLEGHDCPKCRAAGQTMPVPAGHIAVHEYLVYNRSRERVLGERAKAAERQRRSREKSRRDSHNDSWGESHPPQSPPPPPNDPYSRPPGNSRGNPPPVDNQTDDGDPPGQEPVPDTVWDHYARLRLEQQTPGKVKNPSKWLATCKKNARVEHGDQASHWWDLFDIRPERLAQALIDGVSPRNVPYRQEKN